MGSEFGSWQPISWPEGFDQIPQTEFTDNTSPLSEEKHLLACREANEKALEFLLERKALYFQESDVPVQLRLDIDIFRINLAITGVDGKRLSSRDAMQNLQGLIQEKSLHNNGVACLLIKDFKSQ